MMAGTSAMECRPVEMAALADRADSYNEIIDRAEQFLASDDLPACQAALHRAIDLDPRRPEAHLALGTLHLSAQRLDDAGAAFAHACRHWPDLTDAWVGRAAVHYRRAEYPAAFEAYLKALELDTDCLLALLGLFQTSCRMGTFAKITEYLEVYLASHPDDAAVLFCMACLQARDGNHAGASETLRRLLTLEPDHADAADMLARMTPVHRPPTERGAPHYQPSAGAAPLFRYHP